MSARNLVTQSSLPLVVCEETYWLQTPEVLEMLAAVGKGGGTALDGTFMPGGMTFERTLLGSMAPQEGHTIDCGVLENSRNEKGRRTALIPSNFILQTTVAKSAIRASRVLAQRPSTIVMPFSKPK